MHQTHLKDFLIKVWPGNYGSDCCLKSVEESLAHLGTEYLDLLLLHWPGARQDEVKLTHQTVFGKHQQQQPFCFFVDWMCVAHPGTALRTRQGSSDWSLELSRKAPGQAPQFHFDYTTCQPSRGDVGIMKSAHLSSRWNSIPTRTTQNCWHTVRMLEYRC